MSTFYFSEKLGNAYCIGCGERDLGKIWFGNGKSVSPLSQTEAELIATKIVAYLNEKHPISDEIADKYGDSESQIKKIKFLDKFADSVGDEDEDDCDCDDSCDCDSDELFMKMMLMKALMD